MLRNWTRDVLRSERRLEDRYVLAGFLVVTCIVSFALVGDGRVGRLVVVALEGLTLIVILRASQIGPRTLRAVTGAVGVAFVAIALASTTEGTVAHAAPLVLSAGLALGAPAAIVHRLRHQTEIDLMTVAGALCIYLLAGLFFALLYGTIGAIDQPFFAQRVGSGVDYVYYSFITLTTVGYGDLTARLDVGRMCSILEALFGQLYLVSVVAVLVANIGRSRTHPSGVTPESKP